MKLASFFFLSLTVHALALAYPVSFLEPQQPQFIPVVVLPAENESTAGEAAGKGGGGPRRAEPTKSSMRKTSANRHAVESKTHNEPEPQSQLVTATPYPFQNPSSALVVLPSKPSDNETDNASKNSSAHGKGNDVEGIGVNGNGLASSATGGGLFGNGNGASGNGDGAKLTQARYRETPKPTYPESARRKGSEGTVLLRVLVDAQGRAKTIEINKSSGNTALDDSARDAVKRWRFVPAHDGDRAIESWIRIPVDFRLADNKP